MEAETVMYLPAGIIYIYIPAGFCGCLGIGSATTNGAALNLFEAGLLTIVKPV